MGVSDCIGAKSLQLCLTVCDPMDHSQPGSPVHGILQARILEWVASSSRGSSNPGIEPGSAAFQADSLLFEPSFNLDLDSNDPEPRS